MKIIVFSDSHGRPEAMVNAIAAENPDMALYLGDGLRDLDSVREAYPELTIRAVRGNCDFGAFEAQSDEFVCSGRHIIMAHGHKYNVKYGYDAILNVACVSGADVLLFGHTHVPICKNMYGVLMANPGSIGYDGRYGVLYIENGDLIYEAKTL
ncbi:MAG: YfcE family phosphodiesterase [Oscillospiraceae bacterium]|nr:YfcE family phosphodiesterase [Oscillospiraceae bacterium]